MMMSFVGVEATPAGAEADFRRDFMSDDLTIVLVATGKSARRIVAWMDSETKGVPMVEIERVRQTRGQE